MNAKNKIKAVKRRNIIAVIIMCACLWFLTGINFILYPENEIKTGIAKIEKSDSPQGPVEEKSHESKNPTTIQEEYLHNHSESILTAFNNLSLHKIQIAENLQIIYFDIQVPPPKA